MARRSVSCNFHIPMPVALIGSYSQGKPNFMAAGWVCRVNGTPPMIGFGSNRSHATPTDIVSGKGFSVCLPDRAHLVQTDYCGIVSARQADKSKVFSTFESEKKIAPMISDCPVNLECRLVQVVDLPSHQFFIGEIVCAYVEEKILEGDKIDWRAFDPLFLTMPDNQYWTCGEVAGKAWKDGMALKKGT